MPRAASRDPIYFRRRYTPEVIELCVRWYLTYRLSYRDLAAMMAERDVIVSHTTIRGVQRYVPEFERRWAVDRNGKSIHSLLCEDRTVESAQEFFRQAVKAAGSGWPEKINLDGNTASHRSLRLLGDEDTRWQSVKVRARRYLNNIVEQDHRAIKRRCAPMLGLKSFATAAVTLSGIELAHRIRKRQFTVAYERTRPHGGCLPRVSILVVRERRCARFLPSSSNSDRAYFTTWAQPKIESASRALRSSASRPVPELRYRFAYRSAMPGPLAIRGMKWRSRRPNIYDSATSFSRTNLCK